MKKVILVSMLVAACSPWALAQKVGSSSMQFLKVMPVARATALGDAYSVWASGAEAVFWNPAGVAFVDNQEVSVTYLRWIFDTQQGAFSYAASLGSYGAFGLQLQYVDFGQIDEALWVPPYNEDTDYPGLTGRTFHPYAYLIGLSYGSQITDKFSTGISVKHAYESLYNGETATTFVWNDPENKYDTTTVNTWANGLMFDFGLSYDTGFRTIRLAASLQNFGANVRYASEGNPLPMSLRFGIAADLIGDNALLMSEGGENRLRMAFDLFQPNDYAQQAHWGMEYEFSGVFALRAGYKFGYDADGLTAGGGIRQSLAGIRMSIDYSFGALHYSLGNVHRISIGAGF
ncbi:MAG: PorV/PorQ family protein [Bacteroidota bacterium]